MSFTGRAKATWKVGGHEIAVTNLDKLFWPEQGLTKGDLLEFYRDIAPTLLPYLYDRPFIMRLWPDGTGGKNFYRWRLPAHAPDWLERYVYQLQTAQRTAEMPVVDDAAELIWVVNQAVIEMHPWVAIRNAPEQPTWMFFDLDPVANVSFERVLEVAGWIGETLESLTSWAYQRRAAGMGCISSSRLRRAIPLRRCGRGWAASSSSWNDATQERSPATSGWPRARAKC